MEQFDVRFFNPQVLLASYGTAAAVILGVVILLFMVPSIVRLRWEERQERLREELNDVERSWFSR